VEFQKWEIAAAAQDGRDHEILTRRQGSHPAGITARDHDPAVCCEGEAVAAAPPERADDRPVRHAARGIDPADAVRRLARHRRAGWRSRQRQAADGSRHAPAAVGRAVRGWDPGAIRLPVTDAPLAEGNGAMRSSPERALPESRVQVLSVLGEISPVWVSEGGLHQKTHTL